MDATKTRNVTANVPIDLAEKLSALVKQSGITQSQYVGFLIREAVQKKRVFKTTTVEVTES